jgi:3-oxoacyl-[acyl-carrier protein] reductase
MALETALAGRKALITGGVRGLGLAIAAMLAGEGVEIAVADLDPDPAAVAELEHLSGKAVAIAADLSIESEVVRMVQVAIEWLGRVDLFVNNAAGAWHEPVTHITSEAFYKTIDTNLASCVWACREVSRNMIPRRSGAILIVGSTVRFCPAYREASYRISKMGLKMYMETLAIELAPFGIRVNMLSPGHYPTRLTAGLAPDRQERLKREIPMRRFGCPDEVGPAAALLLSDRLSSYITGSEVVIDGGLSLRPLPVADELDIVQWNG